VGPDDALAGIQDSFLTQGMVVALRHEQYVHLLHRLVDDGTLGGQVYDAAIVECARHAGVTELLTFNERHFRRFEGGGLTVVVP
jgi:predicted nucleic acid-binding protein